MTMVTSKLAVQHLQKRNAIVFDTFKEKKPVTPGGKSLF